MMQVKTTSNREVGRTKDLSAPRYRVNFAMESLKCGVTEWHHVVKQKGNKGSEQAVVPILRFFANIGVQH